MPVLFSQTLRSMKSDDYRRGLAGVIIAGVLLTAWGVWFFGAEISIHETSRNAYVKERGIKEQVFPGDSTRARSVRRIVVAAEFDEGARGSLHTGQEAVLIWNDERDGAARSISVIEVMDSGSDGIVRVELAAWMDAACEAREGSIRGVKVEIRKTTPASMAMRAAGL
ncbi:MAG: hypothetical protein GY859_15910 [Desulfobacterales bacterium]|nr:hypothetical protein [Desulfobacterales bacterium]